MRIRVALVIILSISLAGAWYFIRPISYVPGVVEKQIHGFGAQVIPALASNSAFTKTANGYQPKPEPPQAPAGLKPQELQAWMSFAQMHPAAADLVPTFPGHYSEGTQVRSRGMAVLLKPLGSNSASAQIEDGKLVYHNVYSSTDSLNVVSEGRSEEFLLLHDARAPQKFEYDLSTVKGVKNISLSDNSIHFTNAQGQQLQIEAPWLMESGGKKVANAAQWQLSYPNGPSQPRLALVINNTGKLHYPVVIDPTWFAPFGNLNTARTSHTATLLNNGQVLIAGGYGNSSRALASAELYNPATGTWSVTGSLNVARNNHTATLLPNGEVLVAGGGGNSTATSAELYNPATGTWTTTGSLNTGRYLHTATLLPDGQVLVAGGDSVGNSAELYNPSTGTWTATGNLNNARYAHTATLLSNGQVLVAGGNGNSGYLTSAELYNPATGTWTPTGYMNTARINHTATLLNNGQVLVAGGGNSDGITSAELYNSVTGTWSVTGSLNTRRFAHTATLLPSGQVLVAGGFNNSDNNLNSAELYNPATANWTTTASLTNARCTFTATLLPSGQVLVAGGTGTTGSLPNQDITAILTSVELYDPSQGSFSNTGSLNTARYNHTATLLPNGQVLVAGGINNQSNSSSLTSAELYNPANGSWTATGSLNIARENHTATLLPNGEVLVVGGAGNTGVLASAELYIPASGTWTVTGNLNTRRYLHTATLLPNGQVLVAGGYNGGYLANAELYNITTGTWTVTGSLNSAREYHTSTLLPNGQVLVAGGIGNSSAPSSAELYSPATGTWSVTGSLNTSRAYHTATLLPNGQVLVAGGQGASGDLASAELYNPATGTWTATGSLNTSRYWHTATLLPNGQVLVVGGEGPLATDIAELYNPATGTWTATSSLNTSRYWHTATLLPNGQVLAAGGFSDNANTFIQSSAELFNLGLGFPPTTQPQLNAVSSVTSGAALSLIGTNFSGVSEGSDGATNNSASNIPVVQMESLVNEQIITLSLDPSHGFTTSSFTSLPPTGLPFGYALLTMFVNGTPSVSQIVNYSLTTQTIPTLPANQTVILSSSSFTLPATSNNGQTIVYSVVSGPATISGDTVTLTGSGTVLLTAAANGTSTYAPLSQTITFNYSAQSPKILHNFGDGSVASDGAAPSSALVLSTDGNFYGVTATGGRSGNGAVFKLTPTGLLTIMHSFGDGSVRNDGASPKGIILASDGNFYGTTSTGGSSGNGSVFEMTPSGTVTLLHSFGDGSVSQDGATPMAGVIEGSDGNLYGTTSAGGSGQGTLFEISKDGTAFYVLHLFEGATGDGADPVAPLTQGGDGNFYGTTNSGGDSNNGTVFQLGTFEGIGFVQIIHSFEGFDGAAPMAGLVQGSDGNFYGTTSSGGATNTGTVFNVTPGGSLTTLYSFNSNNSIPFLSQSPASGLLRGADGNFYGVTPSVVSGNTTYSSGTIYKVTPQGSVSFLHLFGDGSIANDGSNLACTLVQGADGGIYGTTQGGGTAGLGTVFKLQPAVPVITSSLAVSCAIGNPFSYQITATNPPFTSYSISGALPTGLIFNSTLGSISGTPTSLGTTTVTLQVTNFFGAYSTALTITIGGEQSPAITSTSTINCVAGKPLIFQITATNSPTSYAVGSGPYALPSGLTINSSTGLISGTPTVTGTYHVGLLANKTGVQSGTGVLTMNILSSPPANLNNVYSVIGRFTNGNGSPLAPLVQGLDGNLYGVTSNNNGEAFSISTGGFISSLHLFNSINGTGNVYDDGISPVSLITGADGSFYGTTKYGGTFDEGTVFKMTSAGLVSILHNFADQSVANDGEVPNPGLIQASDGNFYGMTSQGGASPSSTQGGTIFEITPQGAVTILHSFGDGTVTNDGYTPLGGLLEGHDTNGQPDGILYGTTSAGGSSGKGTVFQFTLGTTTLTILHNFGDGSVAHDGNAPMGNLIQANDGNFYGTTYKGGSGNQSQGTVFKMLPQGQVTILHNFGSVTSDGGFPTSGLIQGFDGNLYGTTPRGGTLNLGTVFQLTMSGAETIEHNFSGVPSDGAVPDAPLLQGADGNFYGTTSQGGSTTGGQNTGNGTVFVFQANQTPQIFPTVVGSTTVYAPANNPLVYAAHGLQIQPSVASGITGQAVQTAVLPTFTSLFNEALAYFTTNTSPPAVTSWLFSGTAPPNMTFDSTSGTMTGQLVTTPGMYTFGITPKNNAGAGTQRTVTMYVEQPPTVKSQVNDTPTQGVPYSYQVVVSDYDFPFSYSATGLPGWLSINTTAGTITGTPPGPGNYTFNPVAINLAGSTGLQVTLNVASTVSNAPQITSAATVNAVVGIRLAYPITAINGPITNYTALTLPPGLLFNASTGVISGIPTTPGTYNIPLTATNSSTTYAAILALAVAPVGSPVLSATLADSATSGTSYSYQIPATGTVSSYTATGLPTGLTLNLSTGLIAGTPTVSGTFPIRVTATNGSGTVTATLTLTLSAPNAPPSTDTPTMPPWALVTLVMLLIAVGSRLLPKSSSS